MLKTNFDSADGLGITEVAGISKVVKLHGKFESV